MHVAAGVPATEACCYLRDTSIARLFFDLRRCEAFPQKLAFRKVESVPNYNRAPMTDTKTQITDILIQDCIVRAVQSVFRTMMGQEAKFVARVGAEPSTIPLTSSQIIGSVGFIGGGTLNIDFRNMLAILKPYDL